MCIRDRLITAIVWPFNSFKDEKYSRYASPVWTTPNINIYGIEDTGILKILNPSTVNT